MERHPSGRVLAAVAERPVAKPAGTAAAAGRGRANQCRGAPWCQATRFGTTKHRCRGCSQQLWLAGCSRRQQGAGRSCAPAAGPAAADSERGLSLCFRFQCPLGNTCKQIKRLQWCACLNQGERAAQHCSGAATWQRHEQTEHLRRPDRPRSSCLWRPPWLRRRRRGRSAASAGKASRRAAWRMRFLTSRAAAEGTSGTSTSGKPAASRVAAVAAAELLPPPQPPLPSIAAANRPGW